MTETPWKKGTWKTSSWATFEFRVRADGDVDTRNNEGADISVCPAAYWRGEGLDLSVEQVPLPVDVEPIPIKLKVLGCMACPLRADIQCQHPGSGPNWRAGGGRLVARSYYDAPTVAPDWCPLRKGSLTISVEAGS